ncbi:acetyl xylan esterase [Poronia punctata]|nr:acetyl xylan esterase [Poronia punctata]
MTRLTLGLLGLAASVAAAPLLQVDAPEAAVTCVSGLYMIVARGSLQEPGEGKIVQVTDLVKALVPGSVSVAVDYPASIIGDGTYAVSVAKGINDTIEKVQTYVDACGASSQIALLGSSQGGNVMTNALAGAILEPDPLTEAYTQYIKAVTVFGDPTYTKNQVFNVGNATKSGLFARGGASLTKLNTFADILRSYCMAGDLFCAGGLSLATHNAEVPTWADAAAEFIASKTLL